MLTRGSLELEGRLVGASNASFLGEVSLDGTTLRCIYKPVRGERPLWDFTDGTLAGRERAARVVSQAGGWEIVPPTVLRDGRFGPGMCQRWVDVGSDRGLVDVVGPDIEEAGWIAVLEAEDHRGNPVLLVHKDDDRLRDMAVFDVVINNADRKGGHILLDPAGALWGCDHGVCFH
ncbi:MAG: SCO1664 family protein, partial [Propionibacteriales bacterium]|nr:SCO1664 family protein [Propionibacteriales bacterium]